MNETSVRVDLSGSFTAQDLEEIIRDLAQARAALTPAVAREPPTDLEAQVLTQAQAQFRVRTRANGALRIWLRNEGLGWLAFELDAVARKRFADFITAKLGHTHTFQ